MFHFNNTGETEKYYIIMIAIHNKNTYYKTLITM